jgi:hypothetical protein
MSRKRQKTPSRTEVFYPTSATKRGGGENRRFEPCEGHFQLRPAEPPSPGLLAMRKPASQPKPDVSGSGQIFSR